MKKLNITIIGAAIFAFACAGIASAQTWSNIDYYRLASRYQQLLDKNGTDPLTEKRIADERLKIRAIIEEEINTFVKSQEQTDQTDITGVLDRQRTLVDVLNERMDGSKVDLDLLDKEEGLYKDALAAGTGVLKEGFRTTKTYPELLAKKAILEERIDVLKHVIASQNERLSKLKSEEWKRSMTVLLNILSTIAIFLLIIWLEGVIRKQFLRIQHRTVRYAISKTFTIVVYLTLFFWIAQTVYSDHPGIVAVVAVVGAAIIFTFQEILRGIVGWFVQKNSFSVGQRVTIDGVTGDVIDIGMIHTTLLIARSPNMTDPTQAGQIVRIPNERLISKTLVTYHSTSDFEHVELPICIKKFDQWEIANRIFEEILKEETEAYSQEAKWQMDRRTRGFLTSPESPSFRVHMEFSDLGVLFTLCFPAPIGQRRAVSTLIAQKVLARLNEEKIEIATK
ncbi:MAG: hypothetical protein V1926_00515 [Candidatus Peregrinibacteria bacterium]